MSKTPGRVCVLARFTIMQCGHKTVLREIMQIDSEPVIYWRAKWNAAVMKALFAQTFITFLVDVFFFFEFPDASIAKPKLKNGNENRVGRAISQV